MKTCKLSCTLAATLLLAAGTFTGCETTDSGSTHVSSNVYYGLGSMTHGITAITTVTMMWSSRRRGRDRPRTQSRRQAKGCDLHTRSRCPQTLLPVRPPPRSAPRTLRRDLPPGQCHPFLPHRARCPGRRCDGEER